MVLKSNVISEESLTALLNEIGCSAEEFKVLYETVRSGSVNIDENYMLADNNDVYFGMDTHLGLPEHFRRDDLLPYIKNTKDRNRLTSLCRIFLNSRPPPREYTCRDLVLDEESLYEAKYYPESFIYPSDVLSALYYTQAVGKLSQILPNMGFDEQLAGYIVNQLFTGYVPSPIVCRSTDEFFQFVAYRSGSNGLYVNHSMNNYSEISRESLAHLISYPVNDKTVGSALLRILINIGSQRLDPEEITLQKANSLLEECIMPLLFPKTVPNKTSKPTKLSKNINQESAHIETEPPESEKSDKKHVEDKPVLTNPFFCSEEEPEPRQEKPVKKHKVIQEGSPADKFLKLFR